MSNDLPASSQSPSSGLCADCDLRWHYWTARSNVPLGIKQETVCGSQVLVAKLGVRWSVQKGQIARCVVRPLRW